MGRRGIEPTGPVDPDRAPFYLLNAGDPEEIPYSFINQLDVQFETVGMDPVPVDVERMLRHYLPLWGRDRGLLLQQLLSCGFRILFSCVNTRWLDASWVGRELNAAAVAELLRRGDTVEFVVRDTGVGIAGADLPYVFDRFWRADRARSRTAERAGVGLGLAISQYIAHAHGGSITVASRLGRGSTFTVTLPLEASDAVVAPASDAAPEPESKP